MGCCFQAQIQGVLHLLLRALLLLGWLAVPLATIVSPTIVVLCSSFGGTPFICIDLLAKQRDLLFLFISDNLSATGHENRISTARASIHLQRCHKAAEVTQEQWQHAPAISSMCHSCDTQYQRDKGMLHGPCKTS